MASGQVHNLLTQWVDSANPNKVQGSGTGLFLIAEEMRSAGNVSMTTFKASKAGTVETQSFLYFVLPFSGDATILQAKLWLYSKESSGGAKTLSVHRVLAPWSPNTLTWNNKPAIGPAVHTVASTLDTPILWEIPLQSIMQSISNGDEWYGIAFTMSDTDSVTWWHEFLIFRPYLDLEWVGGVSVPTNLSPDGSVPVVKPIVSFQHNVTDSELDAIQVQVDDSTDMVGAWDSGWVTPTEDDTLTAALDLNTTTFPGIPVGGTRYWRVRQRNAAGQESIWSEVATMTHEVFGTLNITQPSGSTVDDPTPVVTWSYTGGDTPQAAYQVIVRVKDTYIVTYNSGKREGTSTSHTIPSGIASGQTREVNVLEEDPGRDVWPPEPPLNPTEPMSLTNDPIWYTLEVRVWDQAVRSPLITTLTPPDPNYNNGGLYVSDTVDFYLDLDNALAAVTNLAASNVNPWGWCHLTWERATLPDEYAIYVGGKLYTIIPGTAALISGTSYQYTLKGLPPRVQQRIYVLPRVNGVVSLGADDPSVLFTPTLISALLSEVDGSNPIFLLNYTIEEEDFDSHSIYDTLGAGPPILIVQSDKGKRGTLKGGLYGETQSGVTSREEARRFDVLRRGPGRPLMLRVLDYSFTCFIANAQRNVGSDNEGLYYLVSFDYYQMA